MLRPLCPPRRSCCTRARRAAAACRTCPCATSRCGGAAGGLRLRAGRSWGLRAGCRCGRGTAPRAHPAAAHPPTASPAARGIRVQAGDCAGHRDRVVAPQAQGHIHYDPVQGVQVRGRGGVGLAMPAAAAARLAAGAPPAALALTHGVRCMHSPLLLSAPCTRPPPRPQGDQAHRVPAGRGRRDGAAPVRRGGAAGADQPVRRGPLHHCGGEGRVRGPADAQDAGARRGRGSRSAPCPCTCRAAAASHAHAPAGPALWSHAAGRQVQYSVLMSPATPPHCRSGRRTCPRATCRAP